MNNNSYGNKQYNDAKPNIIKLFVYLKWIHGNPKPMIVFILWNECLWLWIKIIINFNIKMIFGLLFCAGYVIGFIQLGMYEDVDESHPNEPQYSASYSMYEW